MKCWGWSSSVLTQVSDWLVGTESLRSTLRCYEWQGIYAKLHIYCSHSYITYSLISYRVFSSIIMWWDHYHICGLSRAIKSLCGSYLYTHMHTYAHIFNSYWYSGISHFLICNYFLWICNQIGITASKVFCLFFTYCYYSLEKPYYILFLHIKLFKSQILVCSL